MTTFLTSKIIFNQEMISMLKIRNLQNAIWYRLHKTNSNVYCWPKNNHLKLLHFLKQAEIIDSGSIEHL